MKEFLTFLLALVLGLFAWPFGMAVIVLGAFVFAVLFGWTYPNWLFWTEGVLVYLCAVVIAYGKLAEIFGLEPPKQE